MAIQAIELPAEYRHGPLDWLVDHNPCYLVSGVCLLLGCYLINAAVHARPDEILPLLMLIAVVNLYELLIIGLGLLLYRVRRLRRDAVFLLVLEVVLLVDAALLYNELFIMDGATGVAVCLLALLAAAGKAVWVLHGLRARLSTWAAIVLGIDVAVIYLLPGLLRTLKYHGTIDDGVFFLLWWGAGVLLALHVLPRWWTDRLPRAVGVAAVALPMVAVIGRLAASQYVYDRPLFGAYLAPLLLGAGVLWSLRFGANQTPAVQRRGVVVCVAAAVAACVGSPGVGYDIGVMVSSLRVTLLLAAMILGEAWWRLGGAMLVSNAAATLLLAVAGDSPEAMRGNVLWLWHWTHNALAEPAATTREQAATWWTTLRDLLAMAVPRGMLQWGAAVVALAFLLLTVGAVVSWSGRRKLAPRSR